MRTWARLTVADLAGRAWLCDCPACTPRRRRAGLTRLLLTLAGLIVLYGVPLVYWVTR